MSCYKNGLMTYNYYDEHPEELEEDRYKVITILENYGLNPDGFITPVKK